VERPVLLSMEKVTASLQEVDDHYAKSYAETRRILQQAMDGMKQTATAADLQAVKAGVSQLETRITAANATSEKTAALLSTLTTRLQAFELATIIRETDEQKKTASAATSDTTQLTEAFQSLQGPGHMAGPIRRWIDQHPDHPQRTDAMFQLALAYVDQRYPALAVLYLERIITTSPLDPVALEAKAMLATIRPSPPVTHRVAKKTTPRVAAVPSRAATPKAEQGHEADSLIPDVGDGEGGRRARSSLVPHDSEPAGASPKGSSMRNSKKSQTGRDSDRDLRDIDEGKDSQMDSGQLAPNKRQNTQLPTRDSKKSQAGRDSDRDLRDIDEGKDIFQDDNQPAPGKSTSKKAARGAGGWRAWFGGDEKESQ